MNREGESGHGVPIPVPIAVDGLGNVTEWVHTDPEIVRHRDDRCGTIRDRPMSSKKFPHLTGVTKRRRISPGGIRHAATVR